MWRLNASGSNPQPPAGSVYNTPAASRKEPLHVSLVLLVGQLLVLAQGAFSIVTGVNLLRGAQTLSDISTGFKPLDLSPGVATGTAMAGIAVGALFMLAGLRVRRMSLRGRLPIALIELLLLLISSVAIAVGGENLSVISVAVLAFAGAPILPGAALIGIEAVVIHALLIHPGIGMVLSMRRAAAVKSPLRVYLPGQLRPADDTHGAPATRYAGPAAAPAPRTGAPAGRAPTTPQLSPAKFVSPARTSAQSAPTSTPAVAPEEPVPAEPKLRVMPPVSPRLVVPARDASTAPAAALDLRIASAPADPAPAAPRTGRTPPPTPAVAPSPAAAAPAADVIAPPPLPPPAPAVIADIPAAAASPPVQPASRPAPPANVPAAEQPPFVGLRPAARRSSKRPANHQLLRPARGAGAELRDVRLKPGVRPRVLPPPDDDEELLDEQ